MPPRILIFQALVLFGMGCASDVANGPASAGSDESGGAYGRSAETASTNTNCDHPPSYEEVSAFNTCVMCHSATRTGAQRTGAPLEVNFDTEAAADAYRMRAMDAVKGGLMPPPSAGIRLSTQEKQDLYDWAMCKM